MLFPIVGRELRVASRKGTNYLNRTVAALLALVVVGFNLQALQYQAPARFSGSIFAILSFMAMVYCVLSGVRSTAETVAAEKSEGTLGFLFLTDLKGVDVVLGKLVAGSVNAFYSLLAILPILTIPLLMGGVTGNQVFEMSLVLINCLFFSLCLGILVSVLSKDAKQAVARTIASLVFLTLGLYLIGGLAAAKWVDMVGRGSGTPELRAMVMGVINLPNPTVGYWLIQSGNLGGSLKLPNPLLISSVFVLLESLFFLVLACLLVKSRWQDRPDSSRRKRLRERLALISHGGGETKQARRRKLLEINPMVWLHERGRFKLILPWAALGGIGIIWLILYAEIEKDWLEPPGAILTMLTMHVILRLWLTREACYRFFDDRKSGAIELLLCTSMSVKDILDGQVKAMGRMFIKPAVVVLIADVILFALSGEDDSEYVVYFFVLLIIFIVDMFAIPWVAMWQGMKVRSLQKASGGTVLRLFGVPAGLFFCFMFMMAIGGGRGIDFEGVVFFWLILCLGADGIFGATARNHLHGEFRKQAARRYEPPTGGIKGFFLN